MSGGQYTYAPFHTIGPAAVYIYDSQAGAGAGAWSPLGRVADAAVVVTADHATKRASIYGLTQAIERRRRATQVSLSFRMLENANPITLSILFGMSEPSYSSLYIDIKSCLAYIIELCNIDISCSALKLLRQCDSLAITTAGANASIPAGEYYYYVLPFYNAPGGNRIYGSPVRIGPVVIQAGQHVYLDFLPPTDWIPDGYLALYATNAAGTDILQLPISASHPPLHIDSHAGATPWTAPSPAENIIVQNYSATKRYFLGVDYSIDLQRGTLKRLEGSTIPLGSRLLITYPRAVLPSVALGIGGLADPEPYRKVKLVQLTPRRIQDSSGSHWEESGLEFIFNRVSISSAESRLPFTEDDYCEGAIVTWECLFDPESGAAGTARTAFNILENW
jgi:hypothetical protein